jgi:hypothetical protein
MDPATEHLAREVAEAFGAAFPESIMAEPPIQPQTPPVAKAPKLPSCDHTISARITPQDSRLCPSCRIARHIQAIKDVQKDLSKRGGVFQSKEKPREHSTIKQRWRVEKIRAINTLDRIKLLLNDDQLSEKDKADIAKAEKLWEEEAPNLGIVPGLVYQGDIVEAEPSEEDHEAARLMIELLRLVLEKEMTKEDKEATTLPIRVKKKAPDAQAHQDRSETSPQHASPPATPKPAPKSATQAAATPNSPRPILKRKATSESPTTPRHKRLHFNEVATISPAHLNLSNPTPFEAPPLTSLPFRPSPLATPPPTTVTTQPHRISTSAEHKRHAHQFKRNRREYAPGTWASGAFEEKANTSWCTVQWDNAEQQMKQEEKEAQWEHEVFAGLKVIVRVWTGLWWVRKVMQHVDLEELKSKMRKE